MALNILHLSDIHFKYTLDGTVYDLDFDVRNELEIDVRQIIEQSGPINAIFVTGDIAFAGKADDYEVARIWLASLCEKIGCEAEQVWVVPGNHDIDRDSVTPLVRTVQNSIQQEQIENIDRCIMHIVHDDPKGAEVLASPLTEYHKFSAIYGCKPKSGHLSWQDDLKLNLGYTLKLIGLNSAIVSNNDDHQTTRPLIVGQAQLNMPRKRGYIYLSLCHHPMSWCKDGERVRDKLTKRVSLQLFGHMHEQALQQIGKTLIIQAGALQPDREHDVPWCPAYNVLTLEVIESTPSHSLSVTVFPRIWCKDHCFSPDPSVGEKQYQRYTLPIDQAVSFGEELVEDKSVDSLEALVDAEKDTEQEHIMANPVRQLVYAFLTLPYSSQIRIADQLSLLLDEDAGLDCAALFERIYERAHARNSLAALWDRVSKEQRDINMKSNPYETSSEQKEKSCG